MEPRQVKTIADAKAIVEQRKLSHVKVGVFDIDGIMRGKYMSRAKFLSALESGYGFCDVVLGWDCQDQLYDNVQFTGWHTGYPDAPVRILPESCRPLPFEDDNLLFLSEFAPPAEQVCPRGILRACWSAARSMGFEPYAGFEYEVFFFNETPESVRAEALSRPEADGAGLVRLLGDPQQRRRGVLPPDARDVRDDGLRHRRAARGDRPRRDRGGDRLRRRARRPPTRRRCSRPSSRCSPSATRMMATFMAKWSRDWPGPERAHPPVAASSRDGKPVFHDAGAAALDERRPCGTSSAASRG